MVSAKKKKREKSLKKLDADQQQKALDAAGCLTPRAIIASLFSLTGREFRTVLDKDEAFKWLFHQTEAQAKVDHIKSCFEMSKKNRSMAIFLLKSRCGFKEADEETSDIEERAQAIREGVEKMGMGLDKFQDKDGNFVKPVGA